MLSVASPKGIYTTVVQLLEGFLSRIFLPDAMLIVIQTILVLDKLAIFRIAKISVFFWLKNNFTSENWESTARFVFRFFCLKVLTNSGAVAAARQCTSCSSKVFNFRLGRFVTKNNKFSYSVRPHLELNKLTKCSKCLIQFAQFER
jgi:hypothetical protein